MPTNDQQKIIERMHALYVEITGREVTLDMSRIFCWEKWLAKKWTEADLRLTVAWIKGGIKMGKRNFGALKFLNLIGATDLFEEDLAEARANDRATARRTVVNPGRAAVLRATGRDDQPPTQPAKSAAQIVTESQLDILRNFRKQNK